MYVFSRHKFLKNIAVSAIGTLYFHSVRNNYRSIELTHKNHINRAAVIQQQKKEL